MLLCKWVLWGHLEKLTVCHAPRIMNALFQPLFVGLCLEETVMSIIRGFAVVLFPAILLTACVTTPGKERAKVHCPACGTDFDAFYQKRF